MGSLAEFKASQVLGPAQGAIAVVAITGSSVAHDLSAMAELQGGDGGEICNVQADGTDTYFALGESGMTVDETDEAAASGDNRCMLLKDGVVYPMRLHKPYMAVKGAASGTGRIRIWRSSGEFTAGV